jgi:hypothetical protein
MICPVCESPVRESEYNAHITACVAIEFLRTNHINVVVRRALSERQANAPVEQRSMDRVTRLGRGFE